MRISKMLHPQSKVAAHRRGSGKVTSLTGKREADVVISESLLRTMTKKGRKEYNNSMRLNPLDDAHLRPWAPPDIVGVSDAKLYRRCRAKAELLRDVAAV